MFIKLGSRSRIKPLVLLRFKSDKYSNIEQFNKSKTKYNFGYNFDSINDLDDKINPEKFKQKQFQSNQEIININEIIESDPSLKQFKIGSPEYKEQMNKLHQIFISNAQKAQKREQYKEGFKGLCIAIVTIIGLISAHQIFMNYGSIKNRIFKDLNYSDFKDTTKILQNTKSKSYKLDKLNFELNDENLNNILDSNDHSGIYYFGGGDYKLPIRIPCFNNMIFKDIYVEKDLIVAVDNKGNVFKWDRQTPNKIKKIELPFNISKITTTENFFYFLTNKGEIIFSSKDQFGEKSIKNWFFKIQKYQKVEGLKDIKQISSGKNHLLLLDSKGRVLILNSDLNPINRGQFGPNYSPFDKTTKIPLNQPIDITLLNNEIKTFKNGEKIIEPRIFTHIASGSLFNIVSDSNGNIWTWGDNSFGQCGELNTIDIKPIPKPIFNQKDLGRICRNIIKNPSTIEIKSVFASFDTSYLLINLDSKQDIILSFGNGLQGQLGGGVYKQISNWPEIIKSLTNLKEFNESTNQIENIGIKDLNVGKNHLFITLDNHGNNKDILVCGSNDFGQFGNGKKIKLSKPIQLPKLLEPNELDKNKIINDLNDVNSKRLSLGLNQRIIAGNDASVIYYCK